VHGAQLWRAAKYNKAAGKAHLTKNRHSRHGSRTQRIGQYAPARRL